jgi:periplasmic protein TonB
MICRKSGFVASWVLLCVSISLGAQEPSTPNLPNPNPPQRVRVAQGVSQGFLLKRVQPEYPKKARSKHVEGTVVMQAVISKTGDIKDLKVISGDELLVGSAVKAVSQWKYRPYLLQGQPVEVETQITVNYQLAR